MNKIRIAVDAMGGDHAPDIVVKGALAAMAEAKEIEVIFYGKPDVIEKKLEDYGTGYSVASSRYTIVGASEVIENTDTPVLAIRRKKESSIVKGLQAVKKEQADAFVSAGSTGAVLAGGTLIVGRIKGIQRPALATFFPTYDGFMLLLDIGANVDCKPAFLHQFAQMGQIYFEGFMGKKNPSVGLANNGTEAGKGNQLTKDTYYLLKEDPGINFAGNIEAREIPFDGADVVVCDGFVGNIILKYAEGLSKMILKKMKASLMSSTRGKIGGALIKPALKDMMEDFDYSEYGGAPLLGLNGLVVKAHGSSDEKAFKNALLQCKTFYDQEINDKIKKSI